MFLLHPDLDDFESFLKDLLETAFDTGGKFLRKHRVNTPSDIRFTLKEEKLRKEFFKQCHRGYDWAQKSVAEKIFSLHQKRLEVVNETRISASPKNDKGGLLIPVIENRIFVLRRVIDSIGYTLLKMEQWVMRRFILHSLDISSVDCKEIKANLREASYQNNRDRQTFSLVCDLSNIFHVGDIFKIDLNKSPAKWEIVELKKGRVNQKLSKIINEQPSSVKSYLRTTEQNLNEKTQKQLRRMQRQIDRMHNIYDIHRTNQGEDTASGAKLIINKEEIQLEHYHEILEKAVANAHKLGTSLHQVDDCLFVLATKESSNFQIEHTLFHLANPSCKCHLLSSEKDDPMRKREIRMVMKNQFVSNFVEGSIKTIGCVPTFMLPIDKKITLDLLFERIRVGVSLAVEPFLDLFQKSGINARLGTQKETGNYLRARNSRNTLLYQKRVIIFKVKNNSEFCLGEGILARMFFDLVRPSSIPYMLNEAQKQDTYSGNSA